MMSSQVIRHLEIITSKIWVCSRLSKRGRFHPDTAWFWNKRTRPIGRRFMRRSMDPNRIARSRSDPSSWKLITLNCSHLISLGVQMKEKQQNPSNSRITALPSGLAPQKTTRETSTNSADSSSSPPWAKRRSRICSRLRTWEILNRSQKYWNKLPVSSLLLMRINLANQTKACSWLTRSCLLKRSPSRIPSLNLLNKVRVGLFRRLRVVEYKLRKSYTRVKASN